MTLNYKDPLKPELDEICSGDQRLRSDHGQAAGDASAHSRTTAPPPPATGSTPARIPRPATCPSAAPASRTRRRTIPPAWATTTAGRWSWPLNRRVLYNRASADLDGKPWDPSRPGIQWDPTEKKWKGDVPDYPPTMEPAQPEGVGTVHHERRGRRTTVLQLDARRTVPRALRAGRVAGREPPAPQAIGVAGGVPVRQGGRPREPLRHRQGLPVHRDQLPADRARALRDAARAGAGRAAAEPVRRDARRGGARRRASRPAIGSA